MGFVVVIEAIRCAGGARPRPRRNRVAAATRSTMSNTASFPEPKIARRVLCERDAHSEINTWLYLSGEFAGDVWAIETPTGTEQVLLRDCRVILGVERKKIQGFGAKLEVGYVFGRRVMYSGNTPEFDPSDTILLRAGVQY